MINAIISHKEKASPPLLAAWLLTLLLSVILGLASIIYEWSGLPLNFGGADLYITIYPPLILCMFWTIWFGFWWGFLPAYLATLILGIYSGLSVPWAILFAFADPIGLAVFAIAYQSTPSKIQLNNLNSITLFILLSFISGIFGSSGSFIWSYSQSLDAQDQYSIWQGWWLGAFLQNILFVAPVIFIFSNTIITWRNKLPWWPKQTSNPLRMTSLTSLVILVGILAYLFITLKLGSDTFPQNSTSPNSTSWKQSALLIKESTQTMYWVLCIVTASLAYFVYNAFCHWSKSLSEYNNKLRASNNKLLAEVQERQEVQVELETVNLFMKDIIELSSQLQSVSSLDKTLHIIQNFMAKAFPGTCGSIELFDENNVLNTAANWGADIALPEKEKNTAKITTLQLKITSGNEDLGLLTISCPSDYIAYDSHSIAMTNEHLALAIKNIKLHEQLSKEAKLDKLTGLYNRHYMELWFIAEISRSKRENIQLGIMILDIDHFKRINDNYGHLTGDYTLKILSSFLKNTTRESDLVCRLGGEEFLVLMPNTSLQEAALKAEHIRHGITQLVIKPENNEENPFHIATSIGIAAFPIHGKDINSLISAADTALYQAKANGRNCVVQWAQASTFVYNNKVHS